MYFVESPNPSDSDTVPLSGTPDDGHNATKTPQKCQTGEVNEFFELNSAHKKQFEVNDFFELNSIFVCPNC